ncbi:MAG TPA: hypothetical protein VF734_09105 [Pseudonocardiaceae bacterium]|jgi:hypothetical protein
MAVVDEPTVERAVLHPVSADTDRTIATVFDVWIEDPDTDHAAWPGKEAETAFIGTATPRRGPGYVLCRRGLGAT